MEQSKGGGSGPAPDAQRTAYIPRTIGGYELIRQLGRGGMGAVYMARQLSMDRIVALKILLPRLGKNQTYIQRFLREARSAAALSHPNIVAAIDAGCDAGLYYFAMEYVDGVTLKQMIREQGKIPEAKALEIIAGVARGLEHAYEHSIVHRDIKPDNIMIAADGMVKLADLGLARSYERPDTVTMHGIAPGTPYYMSPEQARGETGVDTRADIYALGATLYHMVTGDVPFDGHTAAIVLARHITEPVPDPRTKNPALSAQVCGLIQRMMAKKKEERPQTPTAVLEAIEQILEPNTVTTAAMAAQAGRVGRTPRDSLARRLPLRQLPRRTSALVWATAVAAFLALGGALYWWLTSATPERRPVAQMGHATTSTPSRLVEGYVAHWEYAGPYQDQASRDPCGPLHIAFPPEQKGGAAVTWRALPTGPDLGKPYLLKFDQMADIVGRPAHWQSFSNSAIYLRTSIHSATKHQFQLRVGSDDGIKIWLNNSLVHSNPATRVCTPDSDKVDVTLNEGWNDLLVKVSNGGGQWAACIRVVTPDGGVPHHLVVGLASNADAHVAPATPVARVPEVGQPVSPSISYPQASQPHMSDPPDSPKPITQKAQPSGQDVLFQYAEAKRRQRAAADALGVQVERFIDLGGGVTMAFVLIPAGEFTANGQEGITISESFWMGKYEVTQEHWEAVMGNNPSTFKFTGAKKPVEQVSWNDIQGFLQKLNARVPGAGIDLPTEAQWEYACRAGTNTPFYFGETISTEQANYDGNRSYGSGRKGQFRQRTMPVGSFPANAWGLHDMHGNVSEWCSSLFTHEYGASDQRGTDAQRGYRVVRGGSWRDSPWDLRSSNRLRTPANHRFNLIGFRLVRRIPQPLGSPKPMADSTQPSTHDVLSQDARTQLTEQLDKNDTRARFVAAFEQQIRPLLAERRYKEAKAALEEVAAQDGIKLASQEIEASRKDVARLLSFWEAAEKALASLPAGHRIRIKGMLVAFSAYRDGRVFYKIGPTETGILLGEIKPSELLGMLGQDFLNSEEVRLQAAAFVLFDKGQDLEQAEALLAKLPGIEDAKRYGQLIAQRKAPVAEREPTPVPPTEDPESSSGRVTEPVVQAPDARRWKVYTEWPFDEAEAKRRQKATADALSVTVEQRIALGGGVTMAFVLIPAGEFVIGSPPGEAGRAGDEVQRQITISKPFWLGKYEVTQEQWEAVMGANPSRFRGAKNPVEQVSWTDIQGFLQKLNARVRGVGFDLPTEAQWEYACRAGTSTPFYFGETISTDQANYNGNFTYGAGRKGEYRQGTIPVGSLPANAWGLHDMHGNVCEWCRDWYGAYEADAQTDPAGPANGGYRVVRGGSWLSNPSLLRSASRGRSKPGLQYDLNGFRLVRLIPEPSDSARGQAEKAEPSTQDVLSQDAKTQPTEQLDKDDVQARFRAAFEQQVRPLLDEGRYQEAKAALDRLAGQDDFKLDSDLIEAARGHANRVMTPKIYSGRKQFGTGSVVGGSGGTTREAESAVEAGLNWLAKAQEEDGRWDCRRWDGRSDFDVGMTGLALLAFLGVGMTHTEGKFKDTVGKGLEWLSTNQRPDGSFAYRTFYEHGMATMAVVEAYGLTRSPAVGQMAQKAIDHICKIQPDHGGFRYAGAVTRDEGDTSVTSWQMQAIKLALVADLNVPPEVVERSRVFLRNTLREYGGTAYIVSSRSATPAMTAIGMVSRQFLGGDYGADIRGAADFLTKHQRGKPGAASAGGHQLVGDLYYTYYSVLGMFQMGGEYWTDWNKLFRDPLVKCQVHQMNDARGRFVRGSWDPANHRWAQHAGGRVYATAMALLSLEVYYRFPPFYKR